MILCPICKTKVDPERAARTLPFCSDRCRTIDLSRWLGEEYGLPWEPDPDSEEWEVDDEGDATWHEPSSRTSSETSN